MNDDAKQASPQPSAAASKARPGTTALICAGVVMGMVGLSFAAVPLYRLFCQKTGFAGTPKIGTGPSASTSDQTIGVRFDANTSAGIPWKFSPEQPEINVKLGATNTVFYRITNTAKTATTGIATFNIQPDQAAQYFVKIQCFCFTQQTLEAGEGMDAPVVFYVDPAILKDPQLKGLKTITLSYTMFPSKDGQPVVSQQANPDPTKSKL